MKNIYDQTAPAPVSVSIRGDLPRLILNIPRLRRDHNFRTERRLSQTAFLAGMHRF